MPLTNYVPNPSFEDGSVDGWAGTSSISNVAVPYAGARAMQVQNPLFNGATVSGYYDIANPGRFSGKTLLLAGWLRDYASGGAGARLQLVSTVSPTVVGTTYAFEEVQAQMANDLSLLRIYVVSLGPGGGAQNYCYADLLSLTIVGEPEAIHIPLGGKASSGLVAARNS